jgi:hypothetical protein
MWSIEGRCGAGFVVVPVGFVSVVEGTVVVEGRTEVEGTVVVVVLTEVSIVLPPFPAAVFSKALVFSMTLSNCFRAAGVALWAIPLQVNDSHRMATVAGTSFVECFFMDLFPCSFVCRCGCFNHAFPVRDSST